MSDDTDTQVIVCPGCESNGFFAHNYIKDVCTLDLSMDVCEVHGNYCYGKYGQCVKCALEGAYDEN